MPRPTLTGVPAAAAALAFAAALPPAALAQAPDTTPTAAPAAAPTAAPQTPPQQQTPPAPSRPRWRFGPDVGTYLPTNAKTRDRFGGSWLILGLGVGNVSDIHPSGRVSLDLSVLGANRSGEHVLLVPLGVSYAVSLGPRTAATTPYAGVSADAVVADLRSDRDHLPSRTSFTGGGSVFVGARFSQAAYVEARYNALGAVRGFDLSGATLRLGLRF